MEDTITNKKLREFGLTMGFLFPFFIGWFIPKIYSHEFRLWTIYVGAIFSIIGLIRPIILFLPFKLWIKIGEFLGWFNSHLILGLVFIFIVQPISIIMKLSGYDPLRRKKVNQESFKEKRKSANIDLTKIF